MSTPTKTTERSRRMATNRELIRTRLRAFEYVRRVREIADKVETAEPSQVPALRLKADIYLKLLAKVLPDLKSVEHTGEITRRNVTELSDAELADIAAGSRAGTAAPTPGPNGGPGVH